VKVGRRLREIRLAEGLSQHEFARRTGFKQPYICNVERGHKVPKLPVLKKWTMALGISLAEFFRVGDTLPKSAKRVRLTFQDKRLFDALRRMSEADRRLFLLAANKMARRGGKHG
jgi:transcriptional regulator with XRE-family HTH domain